MADWREEADPLIKNYLEKLVAKSAQHKKSYEKAKEKAIAQLWTANAIQEKELYELRMKIEILEKAITVLSEKGKTAEQTALKAEFLEKAFKAFVGRKIEEERIDANKVMREVISRKAPEKPVQSKKIIPEAAKEEELGEKAEKEAGQ